MKIKKILIILMLCLVVPIFVEASGGIILSKSSGSVYVGDTISFKITASNAAGKITVSVDDRSIASINKSSEWIENGSITVNVKGLKVGSTNIKVHVDDVTTFDNIDLSGKTYIFKVSVKEKPNYSTNNNLKSISVEGYNLQKKDNNNYYLSVNKNVESINIKATTEDEKAKVSNTGNKNIKIGENKFEIVITSESGSKNTINIYVTRKEKHTLNDLPEIINEKDVEISLDYDTIVDKNNFEIIKDTKKIVKMDYFDNEKNNVYSWIFDGNKINDILDIKTSINVSHFNEEISKLTNYASSLFLDFAHSGKLISGTKVNINVKDYFNNNDKLKLYSYNKDTKKIELVKEDIPVNDNIISLDIDYASTYFLTKSVIADMSKVDDGEKIKSNNKFTIIFGVIAFIELLIIIYLVLLNKKTN